MQFDLAEVPFSRFGSYMAIDELPASGDRAAGIYLRTLHGDAPRSEVCRIELLSDGQAVTADVCAMSGALRLTAGSMYLDICFADENTVRLRGHGVGVRLIFTIALYDSAIAWRDGWLVNSFSNRMRYALFVAGGEVTCSAPLESRWIFECIPDATSFCEVALVEAQTFWPQREELLARDFSACRRDAADAFAQWLQAVPSVATEFSSGRELAAYVQWSSVVSAQGNFQRGAMLMSKHWFNGVWSWDHCFNAMALFAQQPALAWDQFMLLFDHQNAVGALPDCISDKTAIWNFCKPPIHGWVLQWLLRRGDITREQLQEIHVPLTRWTEWWFGERVNFHNQAGGDDLPHYFHGNDSGWDNASVFAAGMPVQSPDLAAFLVVQMDVLAEVANRLGKAQESAEWKRRADALLEKLLTHCWLGKRFVALHERTPCDGDSLLMCIPLVLGERLPQSIRRELIASLRADNRFLTDHGLASESIASEFYEADGYWRGPMWAPAVFLIVEGLRSIGEQAFADDIARRFCKTVARSGMAENFDALTGAGLRDRAHTWTASVFLLLAHSLEKIERGQPVEQGSDRVAK